MQVGRVMSGLKWVGLTCALMATAASAQTAVGTGKCSIFYDAPPALTQTVEANGFDFKGYDALCARMRRENVGVQVDASEGVLTERAFGWVNIRLYRRSTRIASTLKQANTTLSRAADTPAARKVTWEALNSALAEIARDGEPFFVSLREEEARLKAVLAASPPR
jgi:hypothetical protein